MSGGRDVTSQVILNTMRNWLLTVLLGVMTVAGWSLAAPALADEPVPGAPTAVQAVPGDESVTVSWSPAPGSGADVEYRVTAAPGGSSCSTTSTGCTVPDLINGIGYSVTVVAETPAGTSSASAPSDLVRPVAPPAVALVPRADEQPSLFSWSPADLGSIVAFGIIAFCACALTLLLAVGRRFLGSDVHGQDVDVFELGFEVQARPLRRPAQRPTPRGGGRTGTAQPRRTPPAAKRTQPVRAPVRKARPAAGRAGAARTPQRPTRHLVP